mmetsp:Transcript_18238/g.29087  ORF Transcript_18238/g.29087 Transcript_18238/m.29087 type:complete len:172 (+) Transcript_18238:103-618(+)
MYQDRALDMASTTTNDNLHPTPSKLSSQKSNFRANNDSFKRKKPSDDNATYAVRVTDEKMNVIKFNHDNPMKAQARPQGGNRYEQQASEFSLEFRQELQKVRIWAEHYVEANITIKMRELRDYLDKHRGCLKREEKQLEEIIIEVRKQMVTHKSYLAFFKTAMFKLYRLCM